jgi:hypothetical protein
MEHWKHCDLGQPHYKHLKHQYRDDYVDELIVNVMSMSSVNVTQQEEGAERLFICLMHPCWACSASATSHLPAVGSTQMGSQPALYKPLSSNPAGALRHTYGADVASSALGVTPTLNSSIGQRLTVGLTPGTGGSAVGLVTNMTNLTNAARNAGTEPVAPIAAVKS